MTSPNESRPARRTGFRQKLLVAMMVLVAAVTALGLYVQQRDLSAEVEHNLQHEFQGTLASLDNLQEVRHAALAERCRALVRRPRIHAALEDNALDLLYPSAKDELRDVMEEGGAVPDSAAYTLHAEFYRFLDFNGTVISPANLEDVGVLAPADELHLALNALPREQQRGYLVKSAGPAPANVLEIIAVPIISTETDDVIAALVLGFKPMEIGTKRDDQGMRGGIWVNGRLSMSSLSESEQTALGDEVSRAVSSPARGAGSLRVRIGETARLLFFKRLNPGSLYPPAYQVCLFPLADLEARQRHLRWQVLGVGALMLLIGFAASNFFSARLSEPVEQLAVDSAVDRAQRERAESALEHANVELQRSVRFSADASHQLKTPVTVLRAGLEELLAGENLNSEAREETSQLVHQTYRLTGVIEDLLLLSQMDAGRLQLDLAPLDLSRLVEAELDDLGAQPDMLDIAVEADFPAALPISGERRYTTLIVRNLLENARKYNLPGGRVRVAACAEGGEVLLTIGNTGRPIPAAAQEHIFERFHRGAVAEDVPGHGLGLNLARELVRLHGGNLLLVGSANEWTEFEVRFRLAKPTLVPAMPLA